MTKRRGFTLVELLVSTALIIFILLLLYDAFTKAMRSFVVLKATGDMQETLRSATTLLRRDLSLDHFEGRRRLSDPATTWNQQGTNAQGRPREGFFRILYRSGVAGNVNEGNDASGIASRRRVNHVLHFTIKARGNNRSDFFSGTFQANPLFPSGPPLLDPQVRSNFFDHPIEARYQDALDPTRNEWSYTSQWAEVGYFLQRLTDAAGNPLRAGTTQLFALYRSQFLVVPDNSRINWRPAGVPATYPFPITPYTAVAHTYHKEMSCQPLVDTSNNLLYFNNPTDLADGRRSFNPASPDPSRATLILTDVISFDVQAQRAAAGDFIDAQFDTGPPNGRGANPVFAVRITLRVWDAKTEQTRQISIIQDL